MKKPILIMGAGVQAPEPRLADFDSGRLSGPLTVFKACSLGPSTIGGSRLGPWQNVPMPGETAQEDLERLAQAEAKRQRRAQKRMRK